MRSANIGNRDGTSLHIIYLEYVNYFEGENMVMYNLKTTTCNLCEVERPCRTLKF